MGVRSLHRAGLGLLGLATIVADLLVTKCLHNAEFYYDKKYEIVEEDGTIPRLSHEGVGRSSCCMSVCFACLSALRVLAFKPNGYSLLRVLYSLA